MRLLHCRGRVGSRVLAADRVRRHGGVDVGCADRRLVRARLNARVVGVASSSSATASRQRRSVHGVTPHRRPSVRQYRVAVAIAERRVTSASGAIAALRSVYPEDAEFRAAFADKTLRTTNRRDRRVARFLLFQLEQRASGRSFDLESARYDIEHVLPEHPGDDWRQFDERQRAACAYRLGNLTLLTAAHNRAASNAGYAAKRPIYQSSEFAITSRLAENYETWSAQKIRSRQAWMARQATAIWRIDSWPSCHRLRTAREVNTATCVLRLHSGIRHPRFVDPLKKSRQPH